MQLIRLLEQHQTIQIQTNSTPKYET